MIGRCHIPLLGKGFLKKWKLRKDMNSKQMRGVNLNVQETHPCHVKSDQQFF